jgi:hypothetical protein
MRKNKNFFKNSLLKSVINLYIQEKNYNIRKNVQAPGGYV